MTKNRWEIPTEYSFANLDPSRPLIEHRRLHSWPAFHLIAIRDVERHLEGDGTSPLHLAAWQLASNANVRAGQTIDRFLRTRPTPEDRLSCAHLRCVAENPDDETRGTDIYEALWNDESAFPATHPRRLELGVSLAAAIHPFRKNAALSLLEKVRPLAESEHVSRGATPDECEGATPNDREGRGATPNEREGRGATPTERGMFDIVFAFASLPSDPRASADAILRAHDRFSEASDSIGMAQCALAEFQRLSATSSPSSADDDTLVGLLEYAVHQYEVTCRFAWASATLWSAVVPHLLRSNPDRNALIEKVLPVLERAADFADRARSYGHRDTVERYAARLGLPLSTAASANEN